MGGLLGSDGSNSATSLQPTVQIYSQITRNSSTRTLLLKRSCPWPSQLKEEVQVPLGPLHFSAEPEEGSGIPRAHYVIALLVLLHIS